MTWLRPAQLAKGAMTRFQTSWYGPAKPTPIIIWRLGRKINQIRGYDRHRNQQISKQKCPVRNKNHVQQPKFEYRRLALNEAARLPQLIIMRETRPTGQSAGPHQESTHKVKHLDLRKWKHKGCRKKRSQEPARLQHIYTLSVNRRLERTLRKSKLIYGEIESYLTDRMTSGNCNVSFSAMLGSWATLLERFTEELVVTQRRYTELYAAQTLLSAVLNLPEDAYREETANDILHFWNRARQDCEWPDARQKVVMYISEVRQRLDANSQTQAKPEESATSPQSLKAFQIARLDLAMATVHFTEILLSEFRLRMFYRETRHIVRRLDLIDERLWLTSHLNQSHDYIVQLEGELSTLIRQIRHTAERYTEVSEMAEQLACDAEIARREKIRIFGRPRRRKIFR